MTVTKTTPNFQVYCFCQGRIACREGLGNWGGPETIGVNGQRWPYGILDA